MNYNNKLIVEIDILENLIEKEYDEFYKKLYFEKTESYEIENDFTSACNQHLEYSIYNLRLYINNKFICQEPIFENGIYYTHEINKINIELQSLVSHKRKQFETLYHNFLSDNLTESDKKNDYLNENIKKQ